MKRLLFLAAALLCAASCSRPLGYSVVLWSISEKNISDGEILQVLVKSNITKVYVAKDPLSEENLEVPLWQLSEPSSKAQAEKLADSLRAFQGIYARAAIDGLPIRASQDNISRQTYRLREGEVVKILEKGEDATLTAGAKKFDGAWHRVMAKDGTQGWCFSYNLRIFDEKSDGEGIAEKNEADSFLSKTWRPEIYAEMEKSGRIDLGALEKNWRFVPRTQEGKIEVATQEISQAFDYNGVEKTDDGAWRLLGTEISIAPLPDKKISVRFGGEDSKILVFSETERTVAELAARERSRRAELFRRFVHPFREYESQNYGRLSFSDDGGFVWEGFSSLAPDVIPQGATERGQVSFDIFTTNEILDEFDGAVSFYFSGAQKPATFLFKFQKESLALESVGQDFIRGSLVFERDSNAQVCLFAPLDI